MKLYNGDCLEVMDRLIESGVKVDLVLTDLPYGTTSCKWDNIIPFDEMWKRLGKLCSNENTPIVLFGNVPFTSELICSNIKGFKYRWDWNKKIPSGMVYTKCRPMQQTEDIAVFTMFTIGGKKTNYNPQMIKRDKPIVAGGNNVGTDIYGNIKGIGTKEYKKKYNYKYPTTLVEFAKIRRGGLHLTQKPVELLEYPIKTYTNKGDTVLYFTMGSGSTGVACQNLNRHFIGIELDVGYYKIAVDRLNKKEKE